MGLSIIWLAKVVKSRKGAAVPSYESFGRIQQKHRTRAALKVAAAELIGAGLDPTVVQVADAAHVSRSTAYRYFPSREALQAEVLLDATIGADLDLVYAAAESSPDPAERLDNVVRSDHELVTTHETAFRAAVRAMIRPDPRHPADVPRRPGNRLRYLSTAVQPLRDQLGAAAAERLIAALGLCVGIESLIVTRDICNLSDAQAEEVKRWTAQALLRQALLDAAPKPEAG
jgi:AcrR family transcriptional regulator